MTVQLSLLDHCARRHGGNPESDAAFGAGDKGHDRERVYEFIAARGEYGATLDEVSAAFERPPNALSGRITDLHEAAKIYRKPGETRPTRTGANAAVWVVR